MASCPTFKRLNDLTKQDLAGARC